MAEADNGEIDGFVSPTPPNYALAKEQQKQG
jgi:hypothetical protein